MLCGMRASTTLVLAFVVAAFGAASAKDADETSSERIVSRIRRQSIESSALTSIGYSKRLHALEIEFRNGAIYRYLGVPAETYRQLSAASSKAQFYDLNVRGCYHCVRVKPRDSE